MGWMFLLSTVTTVQVLAFSAYLEDKRELTALFDAIAQRNLPPSEQIKRVLSFLRDKPMIRNESYFFLPVFSFLRPTARQVVTQGGDCADRSRLVVSLLDLRNIRASKWALYSEDLRPQHAVVEAEVEAGKMVVDPLFGLWFPRPEGRYYGIQELAANPYVLESRVQELLSRGEQPGVASLRLYPLDKYVYQNARTINWQKSVAMRLIHRFLQQTLGKSVDEIPRPAVVEEPALMVTWGMVGLQVGIVAFWIITVRWKPAWMASRRSRKQVPSDPL